LKSLFNGHQTNTIIKNRVEPNILEIFSANSVRRKLKDILLSN